MGRPLAVRGRKVKLAFYEVFGDPERNDQITVTRVGNAQLMIPEDTFLNQTGNAALRCKINDNIYQLAGTNGQATIFEGTVLPNTRRQRIVQFTPMKAVEGNPHSGRIVLRTGTLNRGEAIFNIQKLRKNTDAAANSMVCFTPGTRILTAFGELPIEDLRPGDLIHTADNGLQPLAWMGNRKISNTRLHVAPHLRPVKISKDAFGPGLPMADMWVSPAHRFLLSSAKSADIFGESEVLAPAAGLINGTTITTDNSPRDTCYVHLLFEEHQVIFAENLPTESFFACPSTLMALEEEAREQVFEILPDLREHPLCYSKPARLALGFDEVHLVQAA